MSGSGRSSPFSPFLAGGGPVVLDGGLATELERAGHSLDDPLWSARVLLDDPGAIEAVHRAYLAAGADCILTATYQATIPGLAARGLSVAEVEEVLREAVRLAVRARRDFWAEPGARQGRLRPIVGASVGPYGAFLADGSEYRGRYGVGRRALTRFHRRRWEILAASDADLLACETIPSLDEAEVLAELAGAADGKPAWLSFSCRDERSLCDGTPVGVAAALADAAPGVFAVGVNCVDPALAPALVAAIAAETDKPVVAYPNAGGVYDAASRSWSDAPRNADSLAGAGASLGHADAPVGTGASVSGAGSLEDVGSPAGAGTSASSSGPFLGHAGPPFHPARAWVEAGASAVGGCCRTSPSDVRRIRAAFAGPWPRGVPRVGA